MGISVGIIGVGSFGPQFIKLFKGHPDVARLALCYLKPDRLSRCSKEHQVSETYSSLDDICKSDLDALAIFTQHWMHAPQAIQAMRSGKHVYTAVPAARSLDECHDLVETVKQTGLVYMNGETSFFRPDAVFCRKKAEEGAFGEFVHFQAEYFHDISHGLYEVAKNRWGDQWSRDKPGGIPMYYPTHSTCFPISVMKAHMTSVSAQGYIYPNDDWFRQDTISENQFSNQIGLFTMSNGSTARIAEFRRIGHQGTERISAIYGTEASFEQNASGAVWMNKNSMEDVILTKKHEPLPEMLSSDLGGHGGSHAYLIHEFVDSVNRERLPRINVWQAVRYCAPGFVAHESALKDGELLKIPDWGTPPN